MSGKRTPCRYGIKCYNNDPSHLANYSHPQELSDSNDDYTSSHDEGQTPCRYGIKCYNNDPTHRANYFHPEKLSDSDDDSTSSDHEGRTPCRYGIKCYSKDPFHLKEYSHPQIPKDCDKKFPPSDEARPPCKFGANCYRKKPSHLRKYSHPDDNAHSEAGGVLSIDHKPPVYWGKNALTESYSEINVNPNSNQFRIISDLLNSTIGQHGNIWGTIYMKDPVEFIVTKITHIHNKDLWQEYCFRKKRIMKKNNNELTNSASSKYLRDSPLLVPLLDARTNEYWLFHGSDPKFLPILLKEGYDTRVSNVNGMFGGGFYLAENSSKSNQYIPCPSCQQNCITRGSNCKCKNQEDFEYSIILYRTILGDVHIVKTYKKEVYHGIDQDHPVRRPPPKENSGGLYDSVMGECTKYGGDRLNYREFVIYDLSQAYPEYVIQYKRSNEKKGSQLDMKRVKDKCYDFLTSSSS